ncbi:MAG TPA: protein-L-isoaspartate O-methyltransferase, partial [Thermodesulfobacteriota bacterium]|nr:protein-L-isoaspartate O-methyltransferase [Thermodesulfobacteriota bacterium]
GSGYEAAVLSEICREVYTMERIPALMDFAQSALEGLGYQNIFYRVGDGTMGWPEAAPFDGIVVAAGAPDVPQALKTQLSEGGRLSIPVGGRYAQTLYRITRRGGSFDDEELTGCVFVPLVGDQGWKEE